MTRKLLFLRTLWVLVLVFGFTLAKAEGKDKKKTPFIDRKKEHKVSFSGLKSCALRGYENQMDNASGKPGVTVSKVSQNTNEWGQKATFTVVLNSKPKGYAVNIKLSSSDIQEGTIDQSDLTFFAWNWDEPKTITVTGVDDSKSDGDTTYEIQFDEIKSDDPAYDGMKVNSIKITNYDNDEAPIITTNNGKDTDITYVENGNNSVVDIDATDDMGVEGDDLICISIGADSDKVDVDPKTGLYTWKIKPEAGKIYDFDVVFVKGGLKYTLSGDDAKCFDIDEKTGVITWKSMPDYENPTDKDSNNKYEITVTVTDDVGLTDTQNYTITLLDSNESPEITTNGGNPIEKTFEEGCDGCTDIIDVSSEDDKNSEGDGLTYTLLGDDADSFTIDSTTGELKWKGSPDYDNPDDSDGDNIYKVTVTVTDGGGMTDSQDYIIEITNKNDTPDEEDIEKEGVENEEIKFSSTDFTFADGTNPKKIVIGGLPTDGILKLDGKEVTEGMEVDFDNLDDLTFIPDHNWFGETDFIWTGSDGTDWSEGSGSVDIEIITHDHDHDGIPDEIELSTDTDKDGIPDFDDSSMGGGIPDVDKDGIPDYEDTDSDNDNIPDIEEGTIDTDKDGIPDFRDSDSDGDGITDLTEQDLSKLFIPEAFSPNGDDMNDRFEIVGIEKYENKVTIFNRWGNLIFQTTNYRNISNDWDGTPSTSITLGSGKLPEGTYFYVIEIEDIKKPLRGTVYLKY